MDPRGCSFVRTLAAPLPPGAVVLSPASDRNYQDALQSTETWLVWAVCRAGAVFKVPQVILGPSLAHGHLLNSPKLPNFFSCPETKLFSGHFVHLR